MKKRIYFFVAMVFVFAQALFAAPNQKPVVYFSNDITAESLVKVFDATGWKPTGKVAVKMSTGERR